MAGRAGSTPRAGVRPVTDHDAFAREGAHHAPSWT